MPSPILRNGAVRFPPAYARFFGKLGGRPQLKKKSGRQTGWLTEELFEFSPQMDEQTGAIVSDRLTVGTKTFPVGVIPYTAHRPQGGPSSLPISVEGGRGGLALAAEDPAVTRPGNTVDAATERIAEDVRYLSAERLAARTRGGDRGVAKPRMTAAGQPFDLPPGQTERIEKSRRQHKKSGSPQARVQEPTESAAPSRALSAG